MRNGLCITRLAAVRLCLGLVFTVSPAAADAQERAGPADPGDAATLEEVRTRIRDMESSIRSARDETETIMKELQQAEVDANAAAERLREIENEARIRSERIGELHRERDDYHRMLGDQREHLAAQMRAAYTTGRNDFIKLLLNQEDPALIGRMLAYHGYFNLARAGKIEEVQAAVLQLEEVERAINEETLKLGQLRAQEQGKIEELEDYRASRNEVVARLQEHISSRGRELEVLQRNERELADLVEKLQREESVVQRFEELPPFASLKGMLQWPVDGKIVSQFGTPRKGGRLRSQGITISAGVGSDVRAVSAGKVIFADWFRNMGLLVILDHGDGYMSLYAHNETLLKKPGDPVDTGEVIAKVGDTGGQDDTGLYFEIRHGGDPLDPDLWCRR